MSHELLIAVCIRIQCKELNTLVHAMCISICHGISDQVRRYINY